MRRLLLMRHAKSDWDHPGLPDIQRPLNKRGWAAAKKMGIWLQQNSLVPDHILVSPAVRVQETVGRLTKKWDTQPSIETVDNLYPGTPPQLVSAIRSTSSEVNTLMLIAHNPALEMFLEFINQAQFDSQSSTSAYKPHVAVFFPTAAIAEIDFAGSEWSLPGAAGMGAFYQQCLLKNLWIPRQLFGDDSE